MAVRVPGAEAVPRAGRRGDPGVRAGPAAFGAAEAAGLTSLGAATFEVADRMQSANEAVAGERARQQYNREATAELERRDREGDLSQDEEIAAYGEWLATKKGELFDGFSGRANTRAALAADLDGLESQYQVGAAKVSVERRREALLSTADAGLDPFVREVAKNPLRLDEGYAEIDRSMARLAPALTPEQERTMRQRYRGKLATSAVSGAFADQDLARAERLLADEDIIGSLTAEQTVVFAQQAVNAQDRQDARAEKALKKRQEDAAINLRIQNVQGSLTEEDLVASLQRREINRQQFDQLLSTVEGGSDQDNSFTALSLRQGIYDGDIGSAEVFSAFSNGALSQSTSEELLGLVDKVQRRPGILAADETKRARRWMEEQVSGVRGPFGSMDPEDSVRVADAIREFDTRIEELDRAGKPVDAMAVADDLATSPLYARPTLAVGLAVTLTVEQLDAAEDDILARHQRGEITLAVAGRELQRIEDMRAVLDARKQSSAAAEARERLQ